MQREVGGPYRGVANNSAFIKTPQDLTTLSGMRNVRLHAPDSDRPRFGQRPGTKLRFNQLLGGGLPVQAFGVIERSSGTSDYERADSPSAEMADVDANDVFRYSRITTRFKRTGANDGNPFVAFVLGSNLSVDRAFGRVEDSGTAANLGRSLVSPDRPLFGTEVGPTASDILRVSGRFNVGAGFYDEDSASKHQVIMGMQAAWHPRAGQSGDANEHTMIFTSLVTPGTTVTGVAGPQNGALYCSVTCVNVDTGAIKWRNVCKAMTPQPNIDNAIRASIATGIDDPAGQNIMDSNTPINIISNFVLVDTDYTYVAASFYIFIFNTESGKFLQRVDLGGWSQEIQHMMICNGIPRAYKGLTPPTANTMVPKTLRVNFTGTNGPNTGFAANLADNCVGTGPMPGTSDFTKIQALAHWRSGVAEYSIARNNNLTPLDTSNVNVVMRRNFPNKTQDFTPVEAVAETAAFVEHGTLRFSSMLGRNPRGGLSFASCQGIDPNPSYATVTGAALANATFFVGITSRGYGVQTTAGMAALNDGNLGSAAGWVFPDSSVPPKTVAKFAGDGRLVWEVDTESLLREYYTPEGWYNDIPIVNGPGGPEATIMAMACDSDGNVYIAGLRNNNPAQPTVGFNVMKLSGSDGRIIWRQSVSGIAFQHCLRISPLDGTILVSGMRNNSWNDPDTTYAFVWKISPVDGAILDSFDLELEETLWGTGADAANNNWANWCSGFGIDVDAIGRIALVTTPGV